MNSWNALCNLIKSHLSDKLYAFSDEHDFESHYYDYLQSVFHWKVDRIERQQVEDTEDSNRRFDLALKDEQGKMGVIIELKHPSVYIGVDEKKQVCNYLACFNVKFGILTNGKLLLLYYAPNYDDARLVLATTCMSPKDKRAKRLCELLDADKFSGIELENFCKTLTECNSEEDVNDLFIKEQMSSELDEKMMKMVNEYVGWLNEKEKEQAYVENYENGAKEVRRIIEDADKLEEWSREDFEGLVSKLPKWLTNLEKGEHRYKHFSIAMKEYRGDFICAMKHLSEANKKNQFEIIEDFTKGGEYKIKGLDRAFWSEVIRCKFPDVPLVNSKTDDFFSAIGAQIGTSEMEKAKNVSYCYSRWNELWMRAGRERLSLLMFSHIEHFAKVSDRGKQFMWDNFHTQVGRLFEDED